MTGNFSPGNVAHLRNVALLDQAIQRLQNRTTGLPGLATFHGPSGYGKSFAAGVATLRHRAAFVQVKSVWTPKRLVESISLALGLTPGRTIGDCVDQIGEQLLQSGVPLIVDEADFLADKQGKIEVIRDIYESSQGAGCVVLIGEEKLPGKLQRWERVHGRVLEWVAAEPCDMADARALAGIYAHNVGVADDLMEDLIKQTHGSARRISTNLSHLAEVAVLEGWETINKRQWGNRGWFTGQPPTARRGLN